jgi:mediator of RNA polymerase II transcription subunit 12
VGADDSSLVQADAKAIDLLLRILDGSRSANSDASLLAARHRLLDLIAVALQAVERQISDDEPTTEPGHVLNIVLKLLRFVLGWAVNDAPPRPDIGRLAVAYLRVMAVSLPLLASADIRCLLYRRTC